jgi:hypothetical protein
MRLLSLAAIIIAGSAWSFAQMATSAPTIDVLRFKVNPDVHKFTEHDLDVTMQNVISKLEGTKTFKSVNAVADKSSLSPGPGFVLEGVVTNYKVSSAAKVLLLGLGPPKTQLYITFQLTDKVSGKTLLQKRAEGNGATGMVIFGDWSHASYPLAKIVSGQVKKAVKKH